MAPAVCVSSTGRAGDSGISASFAAGRVWMPTKSALSGAQHTDVTGFGASEDHGDGSALPMLVQSGNLSLEIWSDVG
jgi:nicotinamide mononucleotide (NMN) deamidase PncC